MEIQRISGMAPGVARTWSAAVPVDGYAGPSAEASRWPGGKLGNILTGGRQVVRGFGWIDDYVRGVASHQSVPYAPHGATPPRPFQENGKLRVVSWNLHQGVSPNGTGSKPQLEEILAELRGAAGDCYIMQEVAPWHVQRIVDALGMPGYYAPTTFKQGNLILVHPDVHVEDNQKRLMNFDLADGDRMGAARLLRGYVLKNGGGSEPRALQAMRLRLPDGSSTVLWNTHIMSRDFTPGERLREAQYITRFLDGMAPAGERVVGGGDLNSQDGSDVLQAFRGAGYVAQGARIDFIVGRGLAGLQTTFSERHEPDGLQISDHPMVIGEV